MGTNHTSEGPQLVIEVAFDRPRPFPLRTGRNVVGRSNTADIVVPSKSVSGHHAEIRLDGLALRIRDLGSTNGTTVNGHTIDDWVRVSSGDRIGLGEASAYVVGTEPDPSAFSYAPNTTRVSSAEAVGSRAPMSTLRRMAGAGTSRSSRSVFISYAHEDNLIAEIIGNYLRSRGWDVLRDQDFLEPGELWNQRVASAIGRSTVVLALLSPAAAGSQWVNKELVAATNLRRPVMPLVIDDSHHDVLRERMALVVDSHWYTFDRLDPDGLPEVDSHLRRLAMNSRPYRAVLPQERLGSTLIALGGAVLLGCLILFGLGMVRAASGIGSFFDAIASGMDGDPTAGDEAVDAWSAGATDMLQLMAIFPVAFGAMALVILGYVMRRRARKRRLVGN